MAAAGLAELAPVRHIVFRTRLLVALRLLVAGGAALLILPWLRGQLPAELSALAALVPALVVAGHIWVLADGFLGARVTPTHLELQYLLRTTRIARDDVAGARLRTRTRALDPVLRQRAWVASRGGREYRSARFANEQQFRTLQSALQLAD